MQVLVKFPDEEPPFYVQADTVTVSEDTALIRFSNDLEKNLHFSNIFTFHPVRLSTLKIGDLVYCPNEKQYYSALVLNTSVPEDFDLKTDPLVLTLTEIVKEDFDKLPDWISCEKCLKWRRLKTHVNHDIPWACSEINLPCDTPQEFTNEEIDKEVESAKDIVYNKLLEIVSPKPPAKTKRRRGEKAAKVIEEIPSTPQQSEEASNTAGPAPNSEVQQQSELEDYKRLVEQLTIEKNQLQSRYEALLQEKDLEIEKLKAQLGSANQPAPSYHRNTISLLDLNDDDLELTL